MSENFRVTDHSDAWVGGFRGVFGEFSIDEMERSPILFYLNGIPEWNPTTIFLRSDYTEG